MRAPQMSTNCLILAALLALGLCASSAGGASTGASTAGACSGSGLTPHGSNMSDGSLAIKLCRGLLVYSLGFRGRCLNCVVGRVHHVIVRIHRVI